MATETVIDLKPFCECGPGRYDMQTPFISGGKTYATDGRVLVCLDEPEATPDADPNRRFPLDAIEAMIARESIPGDYRPLSEVLEPIDRKHKRPCRVCDGDGFILTKNDAPECKHCDMGEVPSKVYRIYGQDFDSYYVDHLAKLPGIECRAAKETKGPIVFRFDGGVALLMAIAFEKS